MNSELATRQSDFLTEQILNEESCYKVALSLEVNYTILRIMKEKIREMKHALNFITDMYKG